MAFALIYPSKNHNRQNKKTAFQRSQKNIEIGPIGNRKTGRVGAPKQMAALTRSKRRLRWFARVCRRR